MTDYSAAVRPDGEGVLIRVHVVPRSASTGVGGVHGDEIKLRVHAPPIEGKANAAVLEVLAVALGVRRRDLELVAGAKGRHKTVRVRGLGTADAVARLRVSGGRSADAEGGA